ncbi:MAG: MBL fold metallo-hydrolase [Oscillibacter sp.]|nr:MBL fold metallo-hydrolase [Oscillibacter sp.]
MLVLDFINVGNGDAILVRETADGSGTARSASTDSAGADAGRTVFAMLVDCGHDNLIRDDHPQELDPRSRRIYAGDFLKKHGVERLDLLLLTHFHRDHVGGLGRVLDAVPVDRLLATYLPPADYPDLDPDGENGLNSTSRNVLRNMNFFSTALREHPGRIGELVELSGERRETLRLTDHLTMDIEFSDPCVYRRQREIFDRAFGGERDRYALMHWGKFQNVSSLRQRLYWHGGQAGRPVGPDCARKPVGPDSAGEPGAARENAVTEIVLGGDLYAALWDRDTAAPCDILKLPHHASLTSTTRKLLKQLKPKTIVVSVAAGRPDERPHPYTVSLLKEITDDVRFTDAVDIPGLVEPVFHESVHMELE